MEVKTSLEVTIWVVIVAMTLGLFSYHSKRYKSLAILIVLVLIPTWIIASLIRGLEYYYIDNNLVIMSYELFSLLGFTMLLAETLPILIVFGSTTFTVIYLKYKKRNRI